jgi:hypothetical protein
VGALGLAGFALMSIGVFIELAGRARQDFRGTLLIMLMCIGYLARQAPSSVSTKYRVDT